jgi:hypothetical protein
MVNTDAIAELYLKLHSTHKVAEKLRVAQSTVHRALKPLGILQRFNKYSLNHNFFSNDSPESFYWAGFIAADGCVSDKCAFSIGLSPRDKAHVEKFKRAISFKGPLGINKSQARVNFTSKRICDDLGRFNIVPRKSLIYSIPRFVLDHRFVNHFIRGYVDGDGSIGLYPKESGTKAFIFSVVGTTDTVLAIQEVLIKECALSKVRIQKTKSIWALRYKGNDQCKRIFRFLYKDSNNSIRLSRKHRISVKVPEKMVIRKQVMATSLMTGESVIFESIAASVKSGFTPSAVSNCCNGHNKTHKGHTFKFIARKTKITKPSTKKKDFGGW